MKVILSRKGFDSSYGGYPSLILDDGTLQSLPIPNSEDIIKYSDIYSGYGTQTIYDTMRAITSKIRNKSWIELTKDCTCHLDPDINFLSLPRCNEWVGCFGQGAAAQSVLRTQEVGEGDIFLFFGWFDYYHQKCNLLKRDKGDGKHVIFGYLQVDKVLYTAQEQIPLWLKYHPHSHERHIAKTNNCIYIAKKYCTWDNSLPGYGVFNFSNELCLTKDGCSRSKWLLPDIFRNIRITYHTLDSWKDGYFQSAHRGQEFVIEDNAQIEEWAINLIEKNARR